jgi:hypothetical protein
MKTDIRDIYEHIGNLLYAFAEDRGLKPLDFPKLKMLIRSYWVARTPASMGSLVSREGHVVLLTIDWLQSEKVPAAKAYQDFEHFFMVYPEVFTNELKKIIIDTVSEIDQIFEGTKTPAHFTVSELKKLMYPLLAEIREEQLFH